METPRPERLRWDRLLETCYKQRATGALLVVGTPPLLRIGNAWRSLDRPPLDASEVAVLALDLPGESTRDTLPGCATFEFRYGNHASLHALAFGYPQTTTLVVTVQLPGPAKR